jgi:hypothetical protein
VVGLKLKPMGSTRPPRHGGTMTAILSKELRGRHGQRRGARADGHGLSSTASRELVERLAKMNPWNAWAPGRYRRRGRIPHRRMGHGSMVRSCAPMAAWSDDEQPRFKPAIERTWP